MSNFLSRMVARAAGVGTGSVAKPHTPFPGAIHTRLPFAALDHAATPAQSGPDIGGLLPPSSQTMSVRRSQRDIANNQAARNGIVRSNTASRSETSAGNASRVFAAKTARKEGFVDISSEETPHEPQKPLAGNDPQEQPAPADDFYNALGERLATGKTTYVREARMPDRDLASLPAMAEDAVVLSNPSETFVSTQTEHPVRPFTQIGQQPHHILPLKEKKAAAGTSREISEPPVEVKIGRVEIRFDAPAVAAAPTAPPQPRGFSEYAALRTYAARPWFSRNR